ncbi:MAG TPA: cytochrome b/b6 domain-containing protein [Telluria sp.]|nr:cytochrome b/b6 domain-containing protein [Telluria sp.]
MEAAKRILVWDAPVRVFHWLAVLCFFGAYFTAEEDGLRLVHITLGYTLAGLVVFRLVWGVIGSRYARFSEFVHGAGAVRDYVSAMARRQPVHYTGHNPAGALAILALLGLALVLTATGVALYLDIGGDVIEETHEVLGNVMLGLVIAHILAVIISSRLHHENLVAAMLNGHKEGEARDGIGDAHSLVAIVLLVAVVLFWSWQWKAAPLDGVTGRAPSVEKHEHQEAQVPNHPVSAARAGTSDRHRGRPVLLGSDGDQGSPRPRG